MRLWSKGRLCATSVSAAANISRSGPSTSRNSGWSARSSSVRPVILVMIASSGCLGLMMTWCSRTTALAVRSYSTPPHSMMRGCTASLARGCLGMPEVSVSKIRASTSPPEPAARRGSAAVGGGSALEGLVGADDELDVDAQDVVAVEDDVVVPTLAGDARVGVRLRLDFLRDLDVALVEELTPPFQLD